MGALGKQRAKAEYDWSVILQQYENLLNELADRRGIAMKDQKLEKLANMQAIPSFPSAFKQWPTKFITPETRLQSSKETSIAKLDKYLSLQINEIYQNEQPPIKLIKGIFNYIHANGPSSLIELKSSKACSLAKNNVNLLSQTLGWLVKHGFLEEQN